MTTEKPSWSLTLADEMNKYRGIASVLNYVPIMFVGSEGIVEMVSVIDNFSRNGALIREAIQIVIVTKSVVWR
jgi:hypothetical protein